MSEHGLTPKGTKRRYRHQPNKTPYEERENILKQVFSAEQKNQAIGREHPDKGLIVHTDRGAQYTLGRFGALMLHHGFRQSMSRKGNPYDNAIMESFYRTLKRELVQCANYDNTEQAQMDIFKYIETYYNTKRIHSSLGYLSPCQFESKNP